MAHPEVDNVVEQLGLSVENEVRGWDRQQILDSPWTRQGCRAVWFAKGNTNFAKVRHYVIYM